MKKIFKIAIAASLTTSVLVADTDIKKEMTKMRDAMNLMNDGFFYNKKDKIIDGLKMLKEANKMFATPADVKKHLPPKKKHMVGLSFNTAKKININIESMESYITKHKNFSKASSDYTDIINSCTSCHAIVRGW